MNAEMNVFPAVPGVGAGSAAPVVSGCRADAWSGCADCGGMFPGGNSPAAGAPVGGAGGRMASMEDASAAPAPGGASYTDGVLRAAAEIVDWDGLSMPTLEELAGIIERHRTVGAEDVLDFVRRKVAELGEVCPEYVSFAMDGLQLHAGAPVHAKFRVYSQVTGAFEGDDPDALIRLLAEEARGRTEAETLRRQAAELLERARLLDAGRSRPAD